MYCDGQYVTWFEHIEFAISSTEHYLDVQSMSISMRYDGINVTMYAAQIEFLNSQFSLVPTLNHGYLVHALLGVLWIWTVDPLKSAILQVLQLTQ